MSGNLLNIRMHATAKGQHLSGAERLLEESPLVEKELVGMLQRALTHPRGRADCISLKVEEVVPEQVVSGRLLNLTGFRVERWQEGRDLAERLLAEAGVAAPAVAGAMAALTAGAAPDGNSMRGAMLVDACTGERMEPDRARGIRVSRMDIRSSQRAELRRRLAGSGLDRPQVVEALILASKVSAAAEVVAELCWSDDPDYLAGYVASASGYQRISQLKPAGEERGGRAFFIRPAGLDLAGLVDYLQNTPYLIEQLGSISDMLPWPE
ncbi:MAG: 6-carboxyhexanoate--CoA ligase [Desulfuromonas sp.]|nr:MAG: 6-carboxyhexanoate--CoA ligase [Desulfuromonas sp.]